MGFFLFLSLDDIVEIRPQRIPYIIISDIIIKKIHSLDTEVIHASLGIFYTAVSLCIIHQYGYLIGINSAVLHLAGKILNRRLIGIVHRIYHRQRQLAFCHIVARRLSYLRRVVIVENVVAYLEYYPEVAAELPGRLYLVV